MREEVVAYQVSECPQYLRIGAVLQGVPEVLAVDLTVPEKGAQGGVEDARGGGEGERPDLRLVPELPDPYRIWRAFAAGIVEPNDFGEFCCPHPPLQHGSHRLADGRGVDLVVRGETEGEVADAAPRAVDQDYLAGAELLGDAE